MSSGYSMGQKLMGGTASITHLQCDIMVTNKGGCMQLKLKRRLRLKGASQDQVRSCNLQIANAVLHQLSLPDSTLQSLTRHLRTPDRHHVSPVTRLASEQFSIVYKTLVWSIPLGYWSAMLGDSNTGSVLCSFALGCTATHSVTRGLMLLGEERKSQGKFAGPRFRTY